jgi:hypothetical protein
VGEFLISWLGERGWERIEFTREVNNMMAILL